MTIIDRIHPVRPNQKGVALVMAMAFLLILTLIGITAMTSSSLQEKMAGNAQDKHAAFQAAESALIEAEALIQGWTAATEPDFTLNTAGYYEPAAGGTTPHWYIVNWSDTVNGVRPYTTGTIESVRTPPAYIVELLGDVSSGTAGTGSLVTGFAPPPAAGGTATMYRITARGTGGTDIATALVQSVYRK